MDHKQFQADDAIQNGVAANAESASCQSANESTISDTTVNGATANQVTIDEATLNEMISRLSKSLASPVDPPPAVEAPTSAPSPMRAGASLAALRKKTIQRVLASVISFVVITVVILSSQSLAYFTDDVNTGANTILSGNVNIDLLDQMDDGAGGLTFYTDPINPYPATTVSRVVTVKNTGKLPVYIRVKLDQTVNDESGLPADWKRLISCNLNLTDWTLRDGYYYYNRALEPGEAAKPLFDKVAFAPSMGNEFVNKSVQFSITAQATQAYENGTSPLDAVGWPAEQ